jgi:cytochrome oxidase Cu insertion factor (SCO1/SenC/PrrC family)
MNRYALLLAAALTLSAALPLSARGMFEPPVQLSGTVIEHPSTAPDFTLTDQNGSPFHMADTRGKVVVLSFLYTHCTDLCPFVAEKLKSAHDQLGPDADRTVFVAVTTDPGRDTVKVLADYSRSAGLMDAWHFLTGPLPAVKAVWFDYGVGVDFPTTTAAGEGEVANDAEPVQGLSPQEVSRARGLADAFGGGYEVSHSTPIWIIDTRAMIRIAMEADVTPAEIAGNVRALLGR